MSRYGLFCRSTGDGDLCVGRNVAASQQRQSALLRRMSAQSNQPEMRAGKNALDS